MTYENIQIQYPNFCVAPLPSTYATINSANAPSYLLQIKNESGSLQNNFILDTAISGSALSLEYIGPRSGAKTVSTLKTGMPFYTLEKYTISGTSINRVRLWKLNTTNNKLNLSDSFTNTIGSCYSMAVQHYTTYLTQNVMPNDTCLKFNDVTNIVSGTNIYLGLSSNTNNIDAFENVTVTSVSGNYVYTTSITNYYNSNDTICYATNIWLFSDTSYSGSSTYGCLIKLDMYGNVVTYKDSGIFSKVRATNYAIPYYNTIGFIKGTNLNYIDIDDFEIKHSASLLNSDASIVTYALAFSDTTAYRLQTGTIRRNDDGTKTTYTWSTYNYQKDSIISYVDSISMWYSKGCLSSATTTTLYAMVRNQYGVGMSNRVVYFSKVSGDLNGYFSITSKQAITDSNGLATIDYTTAWYTDYVTDSMIDYIYIAAHTDGSNILTGSVNVWNTIQLSLYKKIWNYGRLLQTTNSSNIKMNQITATKSIAYHIQSLSKFQFPGGNWQVVLPGISDQAPTTNTIKLITQLVDKTSQGRFNQVTANFNSNLLVKQLSSQSNSVNLSQTYVSRHVTSGHIATTTVAQFDFILEAIPDFWSEKNACSSSIYLKMAPYGFSLNQSTLSFKIRELSYAGDTGFVEYAGTDHITITPFDAGGGMLGLAIHIEPITSFHHGATVYIHASVYDTASVPNLIEIEYWFSIIQDYKAPYITNELPARESIDISVNTDVCFDILDTGIGVDIETLEVYLNNRKADTTYSGTDSCYHITCMASSNFIHGSTVEVAVNVSDGMNTLQDTWRFYVSSSDGPWIDESSLEPRLCSKGVYRKKCPITINVYDTNGTGIDLTSLNVYVGNEHRIVSAIPIVYRIN